MQFVTDVDHLYVSGQLKYDGQQGNNRKSTAGIADPI